MSNINDMEYHCETKIVAPCPEISEGHSNEAQSLQNNQESNVSVDVVGSLIHANDVRDSGKVTLGGDSRKTDLEHDIEGSLPHTVNPNISASMPINISDEENGGSRQSNENPVKETLKVIKENYSYATTSKEGEIPPSSQEPKDVGGITSSYCKSSSKEHVNENMTIVTKSDDAMGNTGAAKPSDEEKLHAKDVEAVGTLSNVKKTPNIQQVLLNQLENVNDYKQKTMLLLGCSGSGKTTLIKLIASYYLGIESPDEYLSQKSSTCLDFLENRDSLVAYTAFYPGDNQTALTIIDTPGLDNPEEVQDVLSKALAQDLEIHAVGYVIQAHVSRLTPAENLVLEFIKTNFKESLDNIIPLITFADSQGTPPVFKVLEDSGIATDSKYLFNNSIFSLAATEDEEISIIDRRHWKKGFRNWKKITERLMELSPISHHYLINNATSKDNNTNNNRSFNKDSELSGAKSKETHFSEVENKSSSDEKAKKEDRSLRKLEVAILEFADLIDKVGIDLRVDMLRNEVWRRAEVVYSSSLFKNYFPFEKWLYDFTRGIIHSSCTRKVNNYLFILALSPNRPLFLVGCSVIQISQALYDCSPTYSRYCFKRDHHRFRMEAINKVLSSIEDILGRFYVSSFMNSYDYLLYLMQFGEEKYGIFISILLMQLGKISMQEDIYKDFEY